MIPPIVMAAPELPASARGATPSSLQREGRRFVVNLPARLRLRGVIDSIWEGHISNISRRGMQMLVDRPVVNSGRVRIEWDGRDIHGTIRYQRHDDDGYRLGIELTSSWECLVNDVLAHQVEELRESNLALARQSAVLQHQANLLDLTYDTILVTSVDGTISSWNHGAERMYGWMKAEAAGRNVHEMLATVFPCDRALIEATLLDHGRWEGELIQVRKDRSTIVVTSRLALQRTSEGAPAFIMAINSDITDKKMAEQELVTYAEALRTKNKELGTALKAACQASEVKNRFLASVSHELRTPLNGIIGFSQLLHDGIVGPVTTDQQTCLVDVLSCSSHLLTLINQLLDLSKIESGRMEIVYSKVRLEDIVREVINGLRAISGAKRIQVCSHIDSRSNVVETDPARVRQIIFNYVSNALKFTPEGGLVTVSILPESNTHYRIQVEDSGIGVGTEDVARLFTEFVQLTPCDQPQGGTGLGLAITKRIVEALGGSVGVSSAKALGSRFYALLPFVANT
jgi:PAS domain S-box-containing protein